MYILGNRLCSFNHDWNSTYLVVQSWRIVDCSGHEFPNSTEFNPEFNQRSIRDQFNQRSLTKFICFEGDMQSVHRKAWSLVRGIHFCFIVFTSMWRNSVARTKSVALSIFDINNGANKNGKAEQCCEDHCGSFPCPIATRIFIFWKLFLFGRFSVQFNGFNTWCWRRSWWRWCDTSLAQICRHDCRNDSFRKCCATGFTLSGRRYRWLELFGRGNCGRRSFDSFTFTFCWDLCRWHGRHWSSNGWERRVGKDLRGKYCLSRYYGLGWIICCWHC